MEQNNTPTVKNELFIDLLLEEIKQLEKDKALFKALFIQKCEELDQLNTDKHDPTQNNE